MNGEEIVEYWSTVYYGIFSVIVGSSFIFVVLVDFL